MGMAAGSTGVGRSGGKGSAGSVGVGSAGSVGVSVGKGIGVSVGGTGAGTVGGTGAGVPLAAEAQASVANGSAVADGRPGGHSGRGWFRRPGGRGFLGRRRGRVFHVDPERAS